MNPTLIIARRMENSLDNVEDWLRSYSLETSSEKFFIWESGASTEKKRRFYMWSRKIIISRSPYPEFFPGPDGLGDIEIDKNSGPMERIAYLEILNQDPDNQIFRLWLLNSSKLEILKKFFQEFFDFFFDLFANNQMIDQSVIDELETKEDDKIRVLFMKDVPITQIANSMGYSVSTIKRKLKKLGLSRNKRS